MRDPATDETKAEVRQIYQNIDSLLRMKGLMWQDLAARIGIKPKTLSSMKSQNQNMSVLTMQRIAEALSVSVDELLNEDYGLVEDIRWTVERYIPEEKRKKVYDYLVSTCLLFAESDEKLSTDDIHRKRLAENK